MVNEDYCSYEVAKLLKEKGFDEPCTARYGTDKRFISSLSHFKNSEINKDSVNVPTLQMAMKWLREKHNIGIEPWCYDGKWECGFCILPKGTDLYTSFEGTRYNTYEEAVEAAIKYCLENLI